MFTSVNSICISEILQAISLSLLCFHKANLLAAKDSDSYVEHIHDCSNVDQTLRLGNIKHIASISRIYTSDPEYGKPKISACIFTETSAFVLPISEKGPKFVRFHFWPYKYAGLSLSKALFSITVDQYTLLTTTNSSYSDYNTMEGLIVREFCINVDGGNISVTFTPSSMTSGTYAFVNKFEIISMPPRLYIQEDSPFPVIGNTSNYMMRNFTALEMMQRLNVGGPLISRREDTGMYRSWTGELDEDDRAIAAVEEVIRRWFVPEYTAPIKLYVSAVEVTEYTWSFPVDCGFYYLIRLHFCEISAAVKQKGEREFHIFISDEIAEDRADVVRWAGGARVPTYKDYIVNFSRKVGQVKNLSISIGISYSSYLKSKGAILNGLEIFKISDSAKNLAGSYPFGIPSQAQSHIYMYNEIPKVIFRVIFFLYVGLFGIILVFCVFQFKKSSGKKILSSNHCRIFSIAEIKSATNNFADNLLVGTGGFGNVYRGSIDCGTTHVAVKRADPSSCQGLKEFQTEISILSELRHNHLVSLIGYSVEGKDMILVYEYMVRGSLRDHLYKTLKPPMPWKLRLQICIGAARGLHYLHTGKNLTIIHRDIKSTNILLDDKWMAKVSDFGLSKYGWSPMAQTATPVSTVVKGSFGYLDPEYYRRQKLTEKSDVYSFGVVMFEVLCGRPAVLAIDEFEEDDLVRVSLAEWATHCYQIGTIDRIIDPSLKGAIDPECFRTFTDTAIKCLARKGTERPSMGEVVYNLELALRQQAPVDSVDDAVALDDLDDQQVYFFSESDQTHEVESSEIMVQAGC